MSIVNPVHEDLEKALEVDLDSAADTEAADGTEEEGDEGGGQPAESGPMGMQGTYLDPSHPEGFRVLGVKVSPDGSDDDTVISIDGNDNAKTGVAWKLSGKLIAPNTIEVDFSPKAPQVGMLVGQFDGAGITWPDGNRWAKEQGDAEPEAEDEGISAECVLATLDEQKWFIMMIAGAFLVALLTFQTPDAAMWVGVTFAAYSAVANDSIQTLGILIAASKDTQWYILWAYVSVIFVGTVGFSWIVYDGDVSHERLKSKGFDEAPTSFEYLQVAAPIFLLILTRLRMPVSTTFLLLSCFATSAKGFFGLVVKSLTGYAIAIVVGGGFWFGLGVKMDAAWNDEDEEGNKTPNEPAPYWLPVLWASAGFLWSVWLMQNAANIAVYLPRELNFGQFVLFCTPIVLGLGVVMRMGGDKVQEVVEEKSGVSDIRGATVINIIYGAILFFFQTISKVPMSTTWVFVGLLAGRELALCHKKVSGLTMPEAGKLVVRDVVYVSIGFIVSIVIAAMSNPVVADALW